MTEPHAPAATMPFSEEEYHQYQESDKYSGGVVVALMTAIFSIGLLIYTTILIIVW
jgi:hypothetical protein